MKQSKNNISQYFVPTERQKLALSYNGSGKYILYGGARGGGKTELAIFLALYTAKKFPKIKIGFFRKQYRELEDEVIFRFKAKYPENVFKYRYSVKNQMAKFDNGSVIMFRAIETINDTEKIRGVEFQLMIIDEAALFEQPVIARMLGSLRNTNIENYKATLFMTANPGGISDYYLKTRFVFKEIEKWEENERLRVDNYVYVRSSVYDNPYIAKEYIDYLESLDPHLRSAWLDGDWTALEGQFLEQWTFEKHVISSKIEIGDDWRRVGGMDFGMTKEHPTVFVVLAQDPDTFCVYLIREYVNWGGDFGTYIADIADLCNEDKVDIVYADPAMWGDKRGVAGESSYTMFEAEGIPMEPANNSRVNGWRVVKRWLEYNNLPTKDPLFKVFDTCSKTIETATLLRYAERGVSREDCDTRGADDAWDAIRYGLVRGFYYPHKEDIDMLYTLDIDKEKKEREMKKKYSTIYDNIGEAAYYG
jgi:phage terminase large subunit